MKIFRSDAPVRCRFVNRSYVRLLLVALLFSALGTRAHADFSGPYSVPTQTYALHGVSPVFPVGTWTMTISGTPDVYGKAYASTDPAQVFFDTGASAQHGPEPSLLVTLTNTIAASGILSFDYSLTLHETGQLQSLNYGAYTLNGAVIQLQPGVGSVDIPVTAGDAFGFSVYASESCITCNPPFAGAATMTIENFNAPVPEPTAPCLLVFGFVAFTLLKRLRAAKGQLI